MISAPDQDPESDFQPFLESGRHLVSAPHLRWDRKGNSMTYTSFWAVCQFGQKENCHLEPFPSLKRIPVPDPKSVPEK